MFVFDPSLTRFLIKISKKQNCIPFMISLEERVEPAQCVSLLLIVRFYHRGKIAIRGILNLHFISTSINLHGNAEMGVFAHDFLMGGIYSSYFLMICINHNLKTVSTERGCHQSESRL